MKLLLDGRLIGYGGAGVFTSRCYGEMIPMLVCAGHEVSVALDGASRSHPDCGPILAIDGLHPVMVASKPLSLSQHWRFGREIGGRYDRYFYPHFDMPMSCPLPAVSFIHDIIPVAVRGYTSWAKRRYFDLVCARTARRSKAVVVNSEWTKRTLVERYGLSPRLITVAHLGADHLPLPGEKFGKHLLYVGNCKKHKNLDRLLMAYGRLRDDLRERYPLVLIGAKDGDSHAFERRAAGMGLARDVRHVGPRDEATLARLYREARALALVSLHEGFGLPPLEAMRFGVPCVVSGTSALAETAGPGALTVDPEDTAAISAALERVLTDEDLRRELADRGRQWSAGFTWRRCAEKVAAAIVEVKQ